MSDDDKGFLSRWSQLKREARPPEPKPDAPVADADQAPAQVAEGDAAQEFDLSSLPKLEEMTASTDITAFLRKGVPEHLRNAALRKSWVLDPAIRNYVNPALDYAYDWNTPGGVPGSSEIGASTDVARMVLQIMGRDELAAETSWAPAAPGAPATNDAEQSRPDHAAQKPGPELPTRALRLGDEAVSAAEGPLNSGEGGPVEPTPMRESEASDSAAPQQPLRRHGSAKPLV